MRAVRVSAVSFLNTRPLTYGLEHGLGEDLIDLSFDIPSRCAERLRAGEVDVGVIPVAAYAELEGLAVVPGLAIASDGPVRTVLLVGEVPWEQMTTILLDQASRSSAMLLKLLCRARGLAPTFRGVPHDEAGTAASGTTGALVIGDAAFPALERYPYALDLGQEWKRQTGLPFVFAFWAGRPEVLTPEVVALFHQSAAAGLEHRRDIARAWAEANGGDPAVYERYFHDNVQHRLGPDELTGVTRFFDRAWTAGLLARQRRVLLVGDDAPPAAANGTAAARSPAPSDRSIDALLADAAAGQRLGPEDALRLYEQAPTLELGAAADARRRALHPDGLVTYIVDRNINYTNVCVTRCKFCNFYRPPTARDGYVLSRDELARKMQETVDLGGVQILLQGGLNPHLRIDYYEELFRWMKASFPLAIHGLSPEEIRYIAEIEGLSIRQVIERLVAAGLDSIPGGGAEILDDEIRHQISPLKCSTDVWLEVMRQAHRVGLRTTATMVFGFGETGRHIVSHLDRVRALQDETAGFTAFICWSFQAEGTRLKLRDDTTAMRYLRIFSLSRLYLDNFANLQVSWPTMGPEVGQVGLRFGGNDFGSAMIEENVVSQAGAVFNLGAGDIERYIRGAGFTPRRRNMRYELVGA